MATKEDLQKATDALINAVCEAGEAQITADDARVKGTIDFNIAQTHRLAEQKMYDAADEMKKVYVEFRKIGHGQPRVSDTPHQD